MRGLTHTAACEKKAASRERARERWKAKWPNHCRRCEGNTDCEYPCLSCLYELTCPRCGAAESMDEEDANIPCTACGYREGKYYKAYASVYDGCPPEYECECRVAKAEQLEEEQRKAGWQMMSLQRELSRRQEELAKLRRGR